MKRVLLIGTIPPPIGGVSMHIQRFMDKYHTNSEFELDVLDLKKRKLYTRKRTMSLFQIIRKLNYVDMVHLHISNDLKILIAFLSKLLGKKVIYTHHNIRVKNKTLFKVFMSFVDELILVNDNDIHISIKEQYDYYLVPAFLPSLDQTKLPESLANHL
ncbi:MAG TPA: hypothetical protein ENK91_17350, partial [Bacteroidetes bacterium]|nr:hypothetical protein [Bacteroidota bacterium]